jgi:hypothetical protein
MRYPSPSFLPKVFRFCAVSMCNNVCQCVCQTLVQLNLLCHQFWIP